MKQVINVPGAEITVSVRDYVIFLTIQTSEKTQVIRLLSDEAIELYAALDVAIDRAKEAEPQPVSFEQRAAEHAELVREMEYADRGL